MNEKGNLKKQKSKELILAKQLLEDGKLDEADQLINNFEQKGGQTLHDMINCHLLKCEIMTWRHQYEDTVKFAEQTYNESLRLGKNLLSVDILLIMANALVSSNRLDKAISIIKQGEVLLKTFTQELPTDYKEREAYLAFVKGWFYYYKGDADKALKHFEHSLLLREEIADNYKIFESLNAIGVVFNFLKSDFDHALKIVERLRRIAKENNSKKLTGWSFMGMAITLYLKGDLKRSIKYYKQSLKIFNELSIEWWKAYILNLMAEAYNQSDELDHALECIEQAMLINRELGRLYALSNNHDFLIQILINKGDLERAQLELGEFEQLNNQLKDKDLNILYLLDKALILKKSSRTRNKAVAEEILRQIIEDEDSDFELILKALINLCELLLTELRMTNDLEVLEEINPLIARLLEISDKSHSYMIQCETYLLQAKLSLLTFDIKKAQQFLTQAQQIAEKYGLNLLAIKISIEHDELLKQINIWENLKGTSSSLKELMEFARINEQIENMIRKQTTEVPELSNEAPVLLLIVSEGGTPIFSNCFIEDQSFEDYLFGGFFTAINTFINEKFSEGLDRAIFGEYTLLMNFVSPFFICYIFKGPSYLAQKRLKFFINEIKNNKEIWDTFVKFYNSSMEIQSNNIPYLELLINDLFIDKNVSLNQK
ncbi:MAG: tetratricopeptide repeat protein [Promethearchaeota archaeon]